MNKMVTIGWEITKKILFVVFTIFYVLISVVFKVAKKY